VSVVQVEFRTPNITEERIRQGDQQQEISNNSAAAVKGVVHIAKSFER